MHFYRDAPGAGRRISDAAADEACGAIYAEELLGRIRDGQAEPGELAVLLALLRGAVFAGACRVIEKALGGRHA